METFFRFALPIGLAAVTLVLGFGIYTLMRSGAEARSRSNQLMRLRVAVQFVVILLLMACLWYVQNSRGH